jgi:hypothetical protein
MTDGGPPQTYYLQLNTSHELRNIVDLAQSQLPINTIAFIMYIGILISIVAT